MYVLGYKSYAREKRESYDYRKNYLKHNPGLFGGLYLCSQCLTPLSREDMQVDHIIPVSKWFAPNRVINCCAICGPCNRHKSDRITKAMTIKGISMKLFEEFYILAQRLILLIIRSLIILGILLFRVMLRPLKSDRSLVQKGVIVGFYFVSFRFLFLLLI